MPDPSDGRAKTIRLTERGHEARAAAREIFGEIEAEWGERFGRKRVAGLRELLEEILAAEQVATAAR
jgi:DNA-binding MarR family transcriptional regulator